MSTCMYACADLCGCARASALPTHRSLAQAPQHPPPSEEAPCQNGVASKTKIQIEGSLTRFDEQRSRDWQSSAQPAPLTAQSANINDQVVGWHG